MNRAAQIQHARPVAMTLVIATTLALAVAAAGVMLARREEKLRLPEPGNRVESEYREVIGRITFLENQWTASLDKEARRWLDRATMSDLPVQAYGVKQISFLNPRISQGAGSHRRPDGVQPVVMPVLQKFAQHEPGEWVFPLEITDDGSSFIEEPGKPLAFARGNGAAAVVLLVDRTVAARIATNEIAKRLPPNQGPGLQEWMGPEGRVISTGAAPPPDVPPDERFRHVSRFGEWTLRRWYPATVKTVWSTPILAGGFTLAALIVAGGVTVATSQRRALRLAGERVSFVNQVSHELRTPLTNLLLNTDLALDDVDPADERMRRRLGLIREETGRLSRIVDNVLAFARLERDPAKLLPSLCDADRVIEEVRENFAPLFARKSIHCDFEGSFGEEVDIDRDAFAQILSNLLSNVEKYAGEQARAKVSISNNTTAWVIEVSDDGPGIPAEARERIFQPFERVVSSAREGVSGTGLGLAISRELAERMGGRLELVDRERGALFRLEIPQTERRPA